MKLSSTILAAFAFAALFASVACGGDDATGTPGTATAEATSDPAGNVTPFPTPEITGNNVVSESKGYSATFPLDWRPRINLIQTVDSSVDAFFEPLAPDAKAQSSISLTCTVKGSASEAQRIDLLKTTTARQGVNENITVGEVMIAGRSVATLTYVNTSQQNPNQPRLAKVDMIFTGSKCDYIITTTAIEAERARFEPLFDAFVQSFRLLD